MITYKPIPENQHRKTRLFLKNNIPAVVSSAYINDNNEKQIRSLISIHRLHDSEPPKIHDVYFGAYDGKTLVGALHANSFLSQFDFHPGMSRIGHFPVAEVQNTLNIHRRIATGGLFLDEIAVTESFRHQGIGSGLIENFYEQYMKPEKLPRLAVGATSASSRDFFLSQGFENFGDTLPPAFYGGRPLKMLRHHAGSNFYMGKEYLK